MDGCGWIGGDECLEGMCLITHKPSPTSFQFFPSPQNNRHNRLTFPPPPPPVPKAASVDSKLMLEEDVEVQLKSARLFPTRLQREEAITAICIICVWKTCVCVCVCVYI